MSSKYKTIEEFHEVMREKSRQWYQKNKEAKKKYQKEYYRKTKKEKKEDKNSK